MNAYTLPDEIAYPAREMFENLLGSAWRQMAVGSGGSGGKQGSSWQEIIERIPCDVSYFFTVEVDDSSLGGGPGKVSATCDVKIEFLPDLELDEDILDSGELSSEQQEQLEIQNARYNSSIVTLAEHSEVFSFEDDGDYQCLPDVVCVLTNALVAARAKLRNHPEYLAKVEKLEMNDEVDEGDIISPTRSI